MSGHIGLREEARLGHLLARRIARLFPPQTPRLTGKACAAAERARPGS